MITSDLAKTNIMQMYLFIFLKLVIKLIKKGDNYGRIVTRKEISVLFSA